MFKAEGTPRRPKCPGSRQRHHDWEQRRALVRQSLRFVVRGPRHIFCRNSQRDTKAQKHAKNENQARPSHIKDALPSKVGDLRLSGCCVSTGGNCSSGRRNDYSRTSLFLWLICAIAGITVRCDESARGSVTRTGEIRHCQNKPTHSIISLFSVRLYARLPFS